MNIINHECIMELEELIKLLKTTLSLPSVQRHALDFFKMRLNTFYNQAYYNNTYDVFPVYESNTVLRMNNNGIYFNSGPTENVDNYDAYNESLNINQKDILKYDTQLENHTMRDLNNEDVGIDDESYDSDISVAGKTLKRKSRRHSKRPNKFVAEPAVYFSKKRCIAK